MATNGVPAATLEDVSLGGHHDAEEWKDSSTPMPAANGRRAAPFDVEVSQVSDQQDYAMHW